jgi:hypothetical protein
MKEFSEDTIGRIVVIQQINNAYLVKKEASFAIEDRHETSYQTFNGMVNRLARLFNITKTGEVIIMSTVTSAPE